MIHYDLELRRLLLYPHKFIPYDLEPKVIELELFELAYSFFEVKIEQSLDIRLKLRLGCSQREVIQEYKQWVEKIDISKIISPQDRKKIIYEMPKKRQVTTYLYNLYKELIFEKTLTKLTRLEMDTANPYIYYHITNYHRLHNNFRESVKNYFLPKNINANL